MRAPGSKQLCLILWSNSKSPNQMKKNTKENEKERHLD